MRLEYRSLVYETRDRLATITLNRPERLNALDYQSKWDLKSALVHAAADDGIRVVAFRGAGRAFCAGIDLKELSQGRIDERNFALWEECLRLIETMDKLAVALLHGHVLGSGVQLAIACDLRIAATGTRLGLGRAMELALIGESIDATEAKRIGLVSEVVADEDSPAAFDGWLERIGALASQGVRATKLAMREMAAMDYDSALDTYLAHQRRGLASEDFAEAMRAFREKREPRWT
jgi:enoyl-CoA hydratase/carnithine racemase